MLVFNLPEIKTNSKMLDVINANPYVMIMLEHFRFDIAVHKKTAGEIAKDYGISENLFFAFLNLYIGNGFTKSNSMDFNDIDTIILFLKNAHKYYLKDKFPELENLIIKFIKPEKRDLHSLIRKFFLEYYNEVKEHLNYEDKVFFPYVYNLTNKLKSRDTGVKQNKYSSTDFVKHHNNIEDKLLDLKNILLQYIPDKKVNITRRKILLNIFELDYDLKIHTYIEDNILVPLVKRLEKKIAGNYAK
jgi:regulator of cell morphogenesis and NO signaling